MYSRINFIIIRKHWKLLNSFTAKRRGLNIYFSWEEVHSVRGFPRHWPGRHPTGHLSDVAPWELNKVPASPLLLSLQTFSNKYPKKDSACKWTRSPAPKVRSNLCSHWTPRTRLPPFCTTNDTRARVIFSSRLSTTQRQEHVWFTVLSYHWAFCTRTEGAYWKNPEIPTIS